LVTTLPYFCSSEELVSGELDITHSPTHPAWDVVVEKGPLVVQQNQGKDPQQEKRGRKHGTKESSWERHPSDRLLSSLPDRVILSFGLSDLTPAQKYTKIHKT
jgi:hypothetical protein